MQYKHMGEVIILGFMKIIPELFVWNSQQNDTLN